jgi:hypothetical protein
MRSVTTNGPLGAGNQLRVSPAGASWPRIANQRAREQREECLRVHRGHARDGRWSCVEVRLDEDTGSRLIRRVAVSAQRCHTILLLDCSDRRRVVGRPRPRSSEHPYVVGRRAHQRDAGGHGALPALPGDRVVFRCRAGNAGGRIGDDVGPRIHDLGDEVASAGVGNVQHQRLGGDVEPSRRVARVAVRRDDDAKRRRRSGQHVRELTVGAADRRHPPRHLHQDERIPVDECVARGLPHVAARRSGRLRTGRHPHERRQHQREEPASQ